MKRKKKQSAKKVPKLSLKQLNELTEVWYKKLEDEGFQDIERRNKRYMKRESTNIAMNYSQDTEEYYRKARQFMFSEQFQELPSLDQDVWGLHAEGYSYDQILTTLNKSNNLTMLCKRKPFSRHKIQRIVLNIKNTMLRMMNASIS